MRVEKHEDDAFGNSLSRLILKCTEFDDGEGVARGRGGLEESMINNNSINTN